jgi:anti-sigma regulatory factor (Ser/Thr protein kinase)
VTGNVTTVRSFRRSFESLDEIFAFTSAFFGEHRLDRELLPTVDLVLEELFTNMVKYSAGGAPSIRIEMAPAPPGVEVTLTDYDVDRFDVTLAPDADIRLPIEARKPGKLGLHLVRRLVDSLQYEYSTERRESRTTFRKTGARAAALGGSSRRGE